MKNIFLLPTDKPSKLSKFLCNSRELYKTNELALMTELVLLSDCWKNQNIYITNDEEIKVNDYITDGYKVWQWKDDSSLLGRKKVILSTDQDSIKDGVQAIPDDFLEWFVKNPSCEEVEVSDYIKQIGWESDENGRDMILNKRFYEIIIPKEEPKQETLEKITEQIQNECHIFVESVTNVTYQDATNTFLFMKLAELTLKLKKYE